MCNQQLCTQLSHVRPEVLPMDNCWSSSCTPSVTQKPFITPTPWASSKLVLVLKDCLLSLHVLLSWRRSSDCLFSPEMLTFASEAWPLPQAATEGSSSAQRVPGMPRTMEGVVQGMQDVGIRTTRGGFLNKLSTIKIA